MIRNMEEDRKKALEFLYILVRSPAKYLLSCKIHFLSYKYLSIAWLTCHHCTTLNFSKRGGKSNNKIPSHENVLEKSRMRLPFGIVHPRVIRRSATRTCIFRICPPAAKLMGTLIWGVGSHCMSCMNLFYTVGTTTLGEPPHTAILSQLGYIKDIFYFIVAGRYGAFDWLR